MLAFARRDGHFGGGARRLRGATAAVVSVEAAAAIPVAYLTASFGLDVSRDCAPASAC